jgi:S1-C subfamily serine protease
MHITRNQTLLLGCGLLSLVFLCGGLLLAGGFGVFNLLESNAGRGQVAVTAAADPTRVLTGEGFELLVTISNPGDQPVLIEMINLPAELLAIAELNSVNPQEAGREVDGGLRFSENVEPHSARIYTFEMTAAAPGDILGMVGVQAGAVRQSAPLRLVLVDALAIAALTPTATLTPAPTATPLPGLGSIPYRAVVRIFAMIEDGGEQEVGWSGSGSIISPDGLILTNAHVVLPDKYYEITELQVGLTTSDDHPPEMSYLAEVLQADPLLDIAVIRLKSDLDGHSIDFENLDLPFVPIGDSEGLRLGDPLTILGYPGIGGDTITLTRGEVSGFTADSGRGDRAYIKTSATIAGGNSGGLVANAAGELIGVPTQLGYGGEDEFVDCRVLADTNRDGLIDENDNCVPTGGFINALRPVSLALPLIEAAERGEVLIGSQHSPQAEIPMSGEILYTDDFASPYSGWDTGGDELTRRYYQDGEYFIQISPDNYYGWAHPGEDFSDVVITVDVRSERSDGTGDFGVLCRYQDEDNFYALEVSEDGYFAIWKAEAGEFSDLVPWSFSSDIPVQAPVSLVAACVGDQLSLAIDDVLLASVSDDTHAHGDIGLIAGTWEQGDLVIGFDNYVVRGPE